MHARQLGERGDQNFTINRRNRRWREDAGTGVGGGGGGDIKEEGEYEFDLCRKGRQDLTSDICKDTVVGKHL